MSTLAYPDLAPSPELLRFAERRVRVVDAHAPDVERRSETRESFVTPAVVQPVDSELNAVGEAFAAVTRDITRQGIGLIMEELPMHRLFAVHFVLDGEECRLLVNAKWSRHLGPFEYVGCHALAVLEGSTDD